MKSAPVWALGAMSGTSMDGVDAALLQTDGERIFAFGESGFRAYTEGERATIARALGQSTGPDCDAAAKVVERAHVELLGPFSSADVVGFHGQTVLHRPEAAETVQLGNGQALAEALGCPVVWDFRTADVQMGGQGAPLASFYHFALAKYLRFRRPVAFLNIGGVANLTWLDPTAPRPETSGACLAFDTGPGNALMDDLCASRLGVPYDKDGALTRAGTVDEPILASMLTARYFAKVPPKSLDRNHFSDWSSKVSGLTDADAVATLAAGTAGAIAQGLVHCPQPASRILVTGGGRRNPGLLEMIAALADCPVEPVEAHGLDGDMLEAQAFAFLAVRVRRGLPTSAPGTTGVRAPIGGGQISIPDLPARAAY